jgi:hypothetical protein
VDRLATEEPVATAFMCTLSLLDGCTLSLPDGKDNSLAGDRGGSRESRESGESPKAENGVVQESETDQRIVSPVSRERKPSEAVSAGLLMSLSKDQRNGEANRSPQNFCPSSAQENMCTNYPSSGR